MSLLVLCLFPFIGCSTCFGPPCTHLQELTTWRYLSDVLQNCNNGYPLLQLCNTSDKYLQVVSSWRWAQCGPKHVEQPIKGNKHNTKSDISLVSLSTLNYDARSTIHRNQETINVYCYLRKTTYFVLKNYSIPWTYTVWVTVTWWPT